MSQEIDILTPRRRQILNFIVREYIETAMPVSSKSVSSHPGFSVSPATVRNEMAYLEDHEYLTHPHTSAGRVPTEKGYRYFVEQLMEDVHLPEEEQRMIAHQFYQAQLDMNQWMQLAATALAHTARGAAVVVPPRVYRCRLKHMELISIHGAVVLLVLVTQGGLVRQQMLTLDQERSQVDLSRVTRWLNDVFANNDAEEICQQLAVLPHFEQEVGQVVARMMQDVDEQQDPPYRDGLVHVLTQPEFEQNADRVISIFSAGGPVDLILSDMLSWSSDQRGVRIIVGGEGQYHSLSDFSLVLSRYGINGQVAGALGVMGPLRMPYARAVSAVRFVSRLLSNLLSDIYGD